MIYLLFGWCLWQANQRGQLQSRSLQCYLSTCTTTARRKPGSRRRWWWQGSKRSSSHMLLMFLPGSCQFFSWMTSPSIKWDQLFEQSKAWRLSSFLPAALEWCSPSMWATTSRLKPRHASNTTTHFLTRTQTLSPYPTCCIVVKWIITVKHVTKGHNGPQHMEEVWILVLPQC